MEITPKSGKPINTVNKTATANAPKILIVKLLVGTPLIETVNLG